MLIGFFQSPQMSTSVNKSRFKVVPMENNIIINNNASINSVFHVLTAINLLLPIYVCTYVIKFLQKFCGIFFK